MINWGPPGWKFLHAVTFGYPTFPSTRTKKRYQAFFKMLAFVLPCPSCRREFAREPVTIEHFRNRDTLSRWLVKVHNRVNERLGKPKVSYAVVRRRYLTR